MGISREEWLKRKSKKLRNRKYREKGVSRGSAGVNAWTKTGRYGYFEEERYEDSAPPVFSFLENTEETIEYFLGYIREMMKGIYREIFYFNAAAVQEVTLDALAYIIALSKNLRYKKRNRFTISGNIPIAEEPKKVFSESGFLDFFKTRSNRLPNNTDRFNLIYGNRSSGESAKNVCMFVMAALKKDRTFTQDLQNNLVEMMLNAHSHAYRDDGIMEPTWYCCSEYSGNRVRITFLDTGLGIAKTVKKNYFEKARLFTNDSDLMYSAFCGGFRTVTNEDHRGNGLPSICESVLKGYYSRFMVISGSGCVTLEEENGKRILTKTEFKHKIYGTIYVFDIVA